MIARNKDRDKSMKEEVEKKEAEQLKEKKTCEPSTESKKKPSKEEKEQAVSSEEKQTKAACEGEEEKSTETGGEEERQIAVSISAEEYKKLTKAAEERDDFLNRLQRTAAELSNYQKRMERQIELVRQHGIERLIEDLLPVLDSFDRALQVDSDSPELKSFLQGFRMVHDQLLRALAKHGVKEIQAEIGQPFDPRYHEAVMHQFTTELEPSTIAEVLDKGYEINGRVFRAAKVKVAMAPAKSQETQDQQQERSEQTKEDTKANKSEEGTKESAEAQEEGDGDSS